MKKIILSLAVVLSISIAIISCGNKEHDHTEHNTSTLEMYTCPMHPEIVSDKPGSCPKCGMDLVKKETIKKVPSPDSTMKGDRSTKK